MSGAGHGGADDGYERELEGGAYEAKLGVTARLETAPPIEGTPVRQCFHILPEEWCERCPSAKLAAILRDASKRPLPEGVHPFDSYCNCDACADVRTARDACALARMEAAEAAHVAAKLRSLVALMRSLGVTEHNGTVLGPEPPPRTEKPEPTPDEILAADAAERARRERRTFGAGARPLGKVE